MMKEEDDGDDHVHKPVNNKTYCSKAKNQWIELKKKAKLLDKHYNDKVNELGSLCAELFHKQGAKSDQQPSSEVVPGDEKGEKAKAVQQFCEEVEICLEKADAL